MRVDVFWVACYTEGFDCSRACQDGDNYGFFSRGKSLVLAQDSHESDIIDSLFI